MQLAMRRHECAILSADQCASHPPRRQLCVLRDRKRHRFERIKRVNVQSTSQTSHLCAGTPQGADLNGLVQQLNLMMSCVYVCKAMPFKVHLPRGHNSASEHAGLPGVLIHRSNVSLSRPFTKRVTLSQKHAQHVYYCNVSLRK